MKRVHHMPFGATLTGQGSTRFRLWAPAASRVDIRLDAPGDAAREIALQREEGDWFSTTAEGAVAGTLYRFSIDEEIEIPDPCSRFQPQGPHGPSEVVDPESYEWCDGVWRGRSFASAVFYEIHPGAFSPRGDYLGITERLDHIAGLGVTALELMPLAECPGRRNWGYDGVIPFAPANRYGRPEQLKALIDAAHGLGLMVFLDVVYNHFGPEGNWLPRYAPGFFTSRHATPWGAAIDFETPAHRTVRDYFINNALYWLEEYHLDGLRLDAVHAIHDDSSPHFLAELADVVHARYDGERDVHLVLENDSNEARWLERDSSGRPRHFTAQWNDDAHHALHVLITGETTGYYGDFAADPAHALGRCLAQGFAWQGEPSQHRGGALRGQPSAALPPTAFVNFLQNHDQIGNRAFGERIDRLAPPQAVRAATIVLLLAPSPPLLFMGQEWSAPEPFPFFCDFGPEIANAVREGRQREFAKFPEFSDPEVRARIPDACAEQTFTSAVLDWNRLGEVEHREWLALHRTLLRLRHEHIVPLLEGVAGNAGRFECIAPATVRVTWDLAARARLELVARLAGSPLDGVGVRPAGRSLFATEGLSVSDARLQHLPAWSAGWWLRTDS